jgi:hypothetical protein
MGEQTDQKAAMISSSEPLPDTLIDDKESGEEIWGVKNYQSVGPLGLRQCGPKAAAEAWVSGTEDARRLLVVSEETIM